MTLPPEYDDLDDYCLIPSSTDSASLRKENANLKAKIEAMQAQMANVKKQMTLRNEQDQQLRDQIMSARKEVRLVSSYPYKF